MDVDPVFLEWAFKGLVTGIFVYAVKILSKLETSIQALNVKMAVVVEQVGSHDKRITKLEDKE